MENHCSKAKFLRHVKVYPKDVIRIVVYKSCRTAENILEDVEGGKFFIIKGPKLGSWRVVSVFVIDST